MNKHFTASDGINNWPIESDCLDDALILACEQVEECNDYRNTSTSWVDVRVSDGENELSETIELEPIVPTCIEDSHNWVDDGPVAPSGGGVKWNESCSICGCIKHVDTWGQRPDNGQQGFRTVAYNTEYCNNVILDDIT